MSKSQKNRAKKTITTILAAIGLVYLVFTFIVDGTNAADEVSGVIAGLFLVLSTLGILRVRGEPPPPRSRKTVRPEALAGPPVSLTTTGAHALMTALGMPVSRPSCERHPGCPRLINARPFAGPSTGTESCGDEGRPLVVVVLDRQDVRICS